MWVCVCVIVCRHCYGNTQFLHHKAFSLIKLMIKWKFKVTIGGNHNAGYLRKTMEKRRRGRGEVWWVTPSSYTVGENDRGASKIDENSFYIWIFILLLVKVSVLIFFSSYCILILCLFLYSVFYILFELPINQCTYITNTKN